LSGNDSFKSLQGLRVQLESIIFSDFGERVLWSEAAIDLFEAVRNGKIVFMFLDTRRFGETARAIGRFIIQDLKAVSTSHSSVRFKDVHPHSNGLPEAKRIRIKFFN
jgi:hypothetical protein